MVNDFSECSERASTGDARDPTLELVVVYLLNYLTEVLHSTGKFLTETRLAHAFGRCGDANSPEEATVFGSEGGSDAPCVVKLFAIIKRNPIRPDLLQFGDEFIPLLNSI